MLKISFLCITFFNSSFNNWVALYANNYAQKVHQLASAVVPHPDFWSLCVCSTQGAGHKITDNVKDS